MRSVAHLFIILFALGTVTACSDHRIGESEESADGDEGADEAVGAGASAVVPIPTGWAPLTLSAPNTGVRVYGKNGEWVTIVNMKQARVKTLTGTVTGSGEEKGVWTKDYKSFLSAATALNTSTSKLRVLIGGTFGSVISNTSKVSGIAFGLKTNGSLISYGYAVPDVGSKPENQYTGQVKLFTFNNAMNRAWIGSYGKQSFSSPDVIGALDVLADKGPNNSVQRTFVGVRDDDGDGNLETVMVFTSPASTQAHASSVLSAFGAQVKAMLDGSGSTFLMVDGVTKIAPNRFVPHATGFYAGL